MIDWLQYLLESQVCLGLLYGLFLVLFRSLSLFQWNRLYLIMIIVFSLIIPALNFDFSAQSQPLQFNSFPWETGEKNMHETPSVSIVSNSGNDPDFSLVSLLYYLYWIGFFLSGLFFSKKILNIITLIRKSPKKENPGYSLVTPSSESTPFSFFKYIFLSEKIQRLETAKIDQIIAHEQAHVSQWHSLDIIFLELVSVLFWFSPIIYYIKKSARDTHEYLADASVTQFHSSSTYFKLILDIATQHTKPLSNPLSAKRIKQRILFQQNQKSNHMQKLKFLAVAPIVGILAFAFSCSTNHETNTTEKGTFTLVLDAGHGGEDTGASANNVHEKDINLKLAKKIKALAADYDINVFLTREADIAIPLNDRNKASKINCDLFISMHVNQHEDVTRSGIESYYAENERKDMSLEFLDIFHRELRADAYSFVLQEEFMKPANLAVLRTDQSPAILIETGFISNKEDLENLLSDEYTTAFSKALLTSITKYREQL